MSYQVHSNYTDTEVSGVASLALNRAVLNFGSDFRVQSEDDGEIILTNITSPLDRPETVRFGYSEVADVYKNTSIDASVYAPSKRGVSLLAQINDVLSYYDEEAPAGVRYDLPVSAHIVLKFPASDKISASDLETIVGRLVSTLYDTGTDDETRLSQLMRGSLQPADL